MEIKAPNCNITVLSDVEKYEKFYDIFKFYKNPVLAEILTNKISPPEMALLSILEMKFLTVFSIHE